MDFASFRDSLAGGSPPAGLSGPLQALWHAAKGNWDAAHELAMNEESREAAWVHAYLHRLEGDESNAGYWYRKAGKPVPAVAHEAEWTAIAQALVSI
jgi:hypothetical protein